MIRSFIAIDLSPEIQSKVFFLLKELKRNDRLPVKWLHVENMHITLKFLGDVDEKHIQVIHQALNETTSTFPAFLIKFGKLGAFPRLQRARVIWLGCEFDLPGLRLQKSIEEAMCSQGFNKEEKAFHPHLTLGRVSNHANGADLERIAEMIRNHKLDDIGSLRVDMIRIYRSDLLTSGAKYQILYNYPLC